MIAGILFGCAAYAIHDADIESRLDALEINQADDGDQPADQ